MVWMIFVSNWPALPTNGSPCSSSSAPGASPMNMSSALMFPTPNTTFLRDEARCGHFTQAIARSRNSANAAVLASGLSAAVAAGGASVGPASASASSAADGAAGWSGACGLRAAGIGAGGWGGWVGRSEGCGARSFWIGAGGCGARGGGCASVWSVSGETAT